MSRHLPIPKYMTYILIVEGETTDPNGRKTWTPVLKTPDEFVRWLTETYLAQYGVTLGEIVPCEKEVAIIINYHTPVELMDTFSAVSNYVWWIDTANKMNFVPYPTQFDE